VIVCLEKRRVFIARQHTDAQYYCSNSVGLCLSVGLSVCHVPVYYIVSTKTGPLRLL